MNKRINREPKFVFVTGGVVSSLGKGLVASTLAALMESRGLKVANLKMDPYINVDAGTMNPYQHGEVFVTDDGAETDLDLGHYERFTNNTLGAQNNITTGRIYQEVINRERRGDYLGACVQVIPHITDEIKEAIYRAVMGSDIGIIEVGGTVGDIESLPFLEAIRQISYDKGAENVVYIHVTLVPYMSKAGEIKTKPTQHSVNELRSIGIQPDVLVIRSDRELDEEAIRKIALFGSIDKHCVFNSMDVNSIYELPTMLHSQGFDDKICELLNIWAKDADVSPWEDIARKLASPKAEVDIAIVGKYVHLVESYKSLHEALLHGGLANEAKVNLHYVGAETITEENAATVLPAFDAILVPGGFGERGHEGKIAAIHYAREHKIPFFGICLGMQMAVVEYARHVLGLKDADSTEFSQNCAHPVIAMMDEQRKITTAGGTMRLGAYPCHLAPKSLAAKVYNQEEISERHRHRYEFNNEYKKQLSAAGLLVSGTSPDGKLVELIELKDHPWFIGCQYHPEFKSRPLHPHPLFVDFVRAGIAFHNARHG